MEVTDLMWEGSEPQGGCEVCQCSRLITDNFNIHSAGKSPQSRRIESAARSFSSRMNPSILSFDRKLPLSPANDCLPDCKTTVQTTNNNARKLFGSPLNHLEKSIKFNNEAISEVNLKKGRLSFNSPLKSIENSLKTSDLQVKPRPNKFAMICSSANCLNFDSIDEDKENVSFKNGIVAANDASSLSMYADVKFGGNIRSPTCFAENNALDSPLKRKVVLGRRFGGHMAGENGRTPSKFSMVRNLSSPFTIAPHTPSKPREDVSSLVDLTSRDSGFENSTGFDSGSKTHFKSTDFKSSEMKQKSNRFETVNKLSDLQSFNCFENVKTTPKCDDFVDFNSFEGLNQASHSKQHDFESLDGFNSFKSQNDTMKFDTFGGDFKSFEGIDEPSQKCSNYETFTDDFGIKKQSDVDDYEFDTLHDLEDEFDTEIASESVSKYEIISTDSPDITMARPTGHVGRIFARNFEFGSPIGDMETSENFGAVSQPQKVWRRMPARTETTRMLNFDLLDQSSSFSFTTPNPPTNTAASHTNEVSSDSPLSRNLPVSCGGLGSRRSRLFPSLSTCSVGSSCLSEEEDTLEGDNEEPGNLPLPQGFSNLIQREIKENEKESPRAALSPCVIRRPALRKSVSLSLAGCKRAGDTSPPALQGEGGLMPGEGGKRRRAERPALHRAHSENEASIKMALARSFSEPDLIGDFSKPYVLPLAESEHEDLKSISGDTLATLISGGFRHQVASYKIIDCRYPYEFEGGHIPGALNLYTEEMVRQRLVPPTPAMDSPLHREVLVFHCEFSTQRGPNLCRYLRQLDRALHASEYPRLRHPELYLLRGGYCRLHRRHPAICGGYTSMLDPQHLPAMRLHRASAQRRHNH